MNIARRSAIVSLLAAASFLVSACKSSEPAPEQGADPVTVRAAEVTGGQTEGVSLRFSGIVRAAQRATLTFQVSGTLRERAVELGQTVKTGDLLVTSPVKGFAMKADTDKLKPGMLLGKALEPLDTGTGLIKILVMLR